MAKLTRMQKYSEYREQMANDSETATVSEDLNKYQNELNKVKTLSGYEVEELIKSAEKPDENYVSSSAEIAADVIRELTEEIPAEQDFDSVLLALDEIINGSDDAPVTSEETAVEIPEDVEVISADVLADELHEENEAIEEGYRDEINSIIDDLLGIAELDAPEFTASLFDDEEIPAAVADIPADDVTVQPVNTVEVTAEEAEDSAESESEEIHVMSFEIPSVKKNDRSDDEIYADVCERSSDIASKVDGEREYYGVPAPKMWVAPVKEAEPISIDEVLSDLITDTAEVSADDGSYEVSESAETAGEECEVPHVSAFEIPVVKKNEKSDSEVMAQIENCVADLNTTIDSEKIILGIPVSVMWVAPVKETVEEPSVIESEPEEIMDLFKTLEEEISGDIASVDTADSSVSSQEEISETVPETTGEAELDEEKETEPEDVISEIVVPDDDPINLESDSDIMLTKEININYISDVLAEADSYSAKEGLKTVEDITTTIIREVDEMKDDSLEHPVAVMTAPGDTEVVEIKNFSELTDEDREAVLDDTIPFVIDKKMKKEEAADVEEDEDDLIPNKILNVVLIVLIVILLLVLGVVVYYIALAQGLI